LPFSTPQIETQSPHYASDDDDDDNDDKSNTNNFSGMLNFL